MKWSFGVILVLGIALWQSIGWGLRARRECVRMEGNQRAMLAEAETYRVRDSLQAASVLVLTMRSAEVEGHFASLTALVRDMGVKVRRLESLSQTAVESRYEVVTTLRDTVALAAAQALRYDNGHLTIDGIVAEGTFRGQVVSRDTLTQVVHRVPRRFLFFRFGVRELRQEIVSSNPHSRIVYSRFIKIEK